MNMKMNKQPSMQGPHTLDITETPEVNLFVFVHRLPHEDLSPTYMARRLERNPH